MNNLHNSNFKAFWSTLKISGSSLVKPNISMEDWYVYFGNIYMDKDKKYADQYIYIPGRFPVSRTSVHQLSSTHRSLSKT